MVAPLTTPPVERSTFPPLETVVAIALAPELTVSTPPLTTVALRVSTIAPLSRDAPLNVVAEEATNADIGAPALTVNPASSSTPPELTVTPDSNPPTQRRSVAPATTPLPTTAAPDETVSVPVTVPEPETRPPDWTVAPAKVAPDETISVPPLLTVVPLAIPPE